MKVTIERGALVQFHDLPRSIRPRVTRVIKRLAAWPEIAGAKPLRHDLAGHYRVRTGDYRVQFRVRGDEVIVEKIGHRDGFYEE